MLRDGSTWTVTRLRRQFCQLRFIFISIFLLFIISLLVWLTSDNGLTNRLEKRVKAAFVLMSDDVIIEEEFTVLIGDTAD